MITQLLPLWIAMAVIMTWLAIRNRQYRRDFCQSFSTPGCAIEAQHSGRLTEEEESEIGSSIDYEQRVVDSLDGRFACQIILLVIAIALALVGAHQLVTR